MINLNVIQNHMILYSKLVAIEQQLQYLLISKVTPLKAAWPTCPKTFPPKPDAWRNIPPSDAQA